MPEHVRRRWLMLPGFLSALVGDVFLAILGSPCGSAGFLCGVAAFAFAHVFWILAQGKVPRTREPFFAAFSIPLGVFACLRLSPCLPPAAAVAVCGYTLLSAFSLATAFATRRVWYMLGIGCLVVSDLCIGGRWLSVPFSGSLVGPVYIAAECLLVVSCLLRSERRVDWLAGNPFTQAACGGAVSALLFLAGMASFPGGGYNPCMRMLSALGRTVVREVEWPLCHFLFLAGMVVAAGSVARVWPHLLAREESPWRRRVSTWGIAFNAAGLLLIAAAPENVNGFFHNAGCWFAAGGGTAALFARDRGGRDRVWSVVLVGIASVFGVANVLHAAKVIPFAPAVPTCQKLLIVSFMAWILALARPFADARARWIGRILGACVLAVACLVAWHEVPPRPLDAPKAAERAERPPRPLCADEQAALRWLDHVTGPLPDAEEEDWWDIGGRQFGLCSRRYHIAFAGYAAATLGLRGDERERAVVGRILAHCIARYLRRDVWAYSQSRSYWGRRRWAPDPCFRENVMYTGHLLQLLALYERFTGDRTYWEKGFDFRWSDRQVVHYDVKRLIDVTVHQMRRGATGGVACEPGLVFFPCNNHPHVALRLFAQMGHGDWERDARRWERWALAHYREPLFGGGALNLVYHLRSGILYPFGHPGLDGWSLLWYEAWAAERGTAVALWRAAAARIDWRVFAEPSDETRGRMTCADPSDVPSTASAAFLAAAARACGDDATAERLERALDARLVRADGFYRLDLDRTWRIGASAQRIIALAEANGSSWRRELTKKEKKGK